MWPDIRVTQYARGLAPFHVSCLPKFFILTEGGEGVRKIPAMSLMGIEISKLIKN